jgi:MFS family permease
MLGLGLLLMVRQKTGSYAEAGLAAGALSFGNACGLLLQGVLIDRHGPARVVLAAAALSPAALLTLTAAVPHRPAPAVLAALAAAAGATIPAVLTAMRVLCPRVLPDLPTRAAAYALLGTVFQTAMVLGPLLVAALTRTGNPALPLLTAAALTTVSGAVFATAPAVRRRLPRRPPITPAASPTDPPQFRPRRTRVPAQPGVHTLVLGSVGGGVATGMLTVAVAAAEPVLAGLLFAAFSAGELLGGLAYGGRDWSLPARRRLLLGQCGMAASIALLATVAGHGRLMIPVMALIGSLAAPVAIANSALLDDVVQEGSLARAYTVLVAAGLVGMAAGSAAAGRLGGHARATFLLAAGALAAAFLWTLLRRDSLRTAAQRPQRSSGPR